MGIVNSLESNDTESFWLSLKRSSRRVDLRLAALDDVDAAGVRGGDEATLLEDEAEQLVDLAFRRDGARDLDQLAQLVTVAVQPLAAALAPGLHLQELEGLVQRDEQLVVRGLGRQDGSEPAVERQSQIRILRASQNDEAGLGGGEVLGERLEQLASPVPYRRGQQQYEMRAAPHHHEQRVGSRDDAVVQPRVGGERVGQARQ